MVMLAVLQRSGGVEAVSRHLSLAPNEGGQVAEALVPGVLAAYHRVFENAPAPPAGECPQLAGVRAVQAMLAPFGGGTLAIDILIPGTVPPATAKALRDLVFPGKGAVAGFIAERAAATGLDPAMLDAALPMLTTLVGGYLAARIESASGRSADLVAEFEQLFIQGDDDPAPPEAR